MAKVNAVGAAMAMAVGAAMAVAVGAAMSVAVGLQWQSRWVCNGSCGGGCNGGVGEEVYHWKRCHLKVIFAICVFCKSGLSK